MRNIVFIILLAATMMAQKNRCRRYLLLNRFPSRQPPETTLMHRKQSCLAAWSSRCIPRGRRT